VDCYQSIGPTLSEYGVTIALEPLNRFETYFLNTAADAVALCDAIGHPNVGILFDTFHANIEEKDVAAGVSHGGAAFEARTHLRERPRHSGHGHVDWPGVFQALRDIHYDGWLTIESFGFALGELSAAASIWRDIAPSPESIAFEGVKFLKRGMA
jgi:D-psicose/D-tagatose/L-ribulose 3-epimerase